MSVDDLTITGSEISASLTLRVVGLGAMRARWSVAMMIIRLASVVAGCKLDLSLKSDEGEPKDAGPMVLTTTERLTPGQSSVLRKWRMHNQERIYL